MQKKEASAALLVGIAAGLGFAYLIFGSSKTAPRTSRQPLPELEELRVIEERSEQETKKEPAQARSVAKRLIDYLLQAEDPWPMRDPRVPKEQKEVVQESQQQQSPLPPPQPKLLEEGQIKPREVTVAKPKKPQPPSLKALPPPPPREPVYRNEILVPEVAEKIASKAPQPIKEKPLPRQRVENLPFEVLTPKVRDSRFQYLYAQQSKYMGMRWRKFISRRNHFTCWVPGQLYYHLYTDQEKTELYHCEFRQVIYGVQRQEIEAYERPVGRGNQLAFFRAAAGLWIDQYMEETPEVRVLYQTLYQNPYLAQDVMIIGPHGQTKMQIALRGHGLYWFWGAYRNDRIGQERFDDFLTSFDILK